MAARTLDCCAAIPESTTDIALLLARIAGTEP